MNSKNTDKWSHPMYSIGVMLIVWVFLLRAFSGHLNGALLLALYTFPIWIFPAMIIFMILITIALAFLALVLFGPTVLVYHICRKIDKSEQNNQEEDSND